MKKLSQEEFSNLSLKGRGRSSEVYNSIINLKVGEALLIEPKDWNRKAGPSSLVKYIEKTQGLKFTYSALAEGSGWVIKRIEAKPLFSATHSEPKALVHTTSSVKTPNLREDPTNLKAELTIFYLGRIGFRKIEKIVDSVKAAQEHFRDEPGSLIKELLEEIISVLSKQRHIIVENEKTYVPLKKH